MCQLRNSQGSHTLMARERVNLRDGKLRAIGRFFSRLRCSVTSRSCHMGQSPHALHALDFQPEITHDVGIVWGAGCGCDERICH